MNIDAVTALAAKEDLLFIVERWGALQARLVPGGGNALNGMPRATERRLPIDMHISDLMREIEDNVARFYGHILHDETEDWQPETSTMPGLLAAVAERYGHFTTDDAEMALGFCDDAAEYRDRVTKALERPAPPVYQGPCPQDNCAGELYLREGRDKGRCQECGTEFTRDEQREHVAARMQDRLMTTSEIVRALKILAMPVPYDVVAKWTQGEAPRLVEAVPDEGLYHLADAMGLAATYKPRRRAA